MKIKKIAITGGIGSGKSTLIEIIKSFGYPVLSCDEECKNLYKTHSFKVKLKETFPNAVKGEKRLTIDRKFLSNLVFNDKDKLNKLNNLTHPLIMERIDKKAVNVGKIKGVVFVEVPLLFESNLENTFDNILIVYRDRNARIESVKIRSNLSKEEIEKRIDSQFDYDTIDRKKYIVIDNNCSIEELKEKVKEYLHTL